MEAPQTEPSPPTARWTLLQALWTLPTAQEPAWEPSAATPVTLCHPRLPL